MRCNAWAYGVKTLRYAQAFTPKGCDKRKHYLRRLCRAKRNGQPVVYMDETGFAASTHRTHARALGGQKVHGLQSAYSRPRTSVIGAYRDNKLIAPMLFEGTCNSAVFHDWVEQMLLPELVCGSVIVLDNAAFHTSKRTQRLIEQSGCELLFLPPYCPDLNPIEKLWGHLKRLRRNTGASVDELIRMSDYSWC
ncbi:IS630 family transposase [Ottowia testudinis]|uniref:IS630 family transposase n=1 Tax=Ottowia testudinis TaxID=2816950 RepID=UPI0024DF2C5F|nr:IS630 family transposase [Ottowia testudinis]